MSRRLLEAPGSAIRGNDGALRGTERPRRSTTGRRVGVIAVLVAAVCLGAPDVRSAATCETTFTGLGGNDLFTNAANWDNGAPDTSKHACIVGTFTARATSFTQAEGITVGAGATLVLDSTSGTSFLTVGGGEVLNNGTIQLTGTSTNQVSFSGAGSMTNNGTVTFAGSAGIGGGTITNAAGGQLTVAAGKTFTVASNSFTNAGVVTVTGTIQGASVPAITLQSGTFAGGGTATFQGQSGNTFTWNDGSVAAGTDLIVDGGYETILAGGTGAIAIDFFGGLRGTVGAGQTLHVRAPVAVTGDVVNRGTILLGQFAQLQLNGSGLRNEATMTSTGSSTSVLFGPFTNAAAGTLTIDAGSTLSSDGALTNEGALVVNGTFMSGGVSTSGTASGTGTLQLNGATLSGTGSLLTNVALVGGTLAPGNSPGVINVSSLTLSSNTVTDVELGGTDLGDFDQVNASGGFVLAGTLDLSIVGGYQPAVCDSFKIITGSSVTGAFATINGTNLGGGLTLVPFQRADGLTLVVSTSGAPLGLGPSSVSVSEDGATDTYEICLGAEPTSTVTVTAAVAGSQVTTSPAPVTFVPGGAPTRTVTVASADDGVVEANPHQDTIESTTASSDANFDGLTLATVTATVADHVVGPPPPPPTTTPGPTAPSTTAPPPTGGPVVGPTTGGGGRSRAVQVAGVVVAASPASAATTTTTTTRPSNERATGPVSNPSSGGSAVAAPDTRAVAQFSPFDDPRETVGLQAAFLAVLLLTAGGAASNARGRRPNWVDSKEALVTLGGSGGAPQRFTGVGGGGVDGRGRDGSVAGRGDALTAADEAGATAMAVIRSSGGKRSDDLPGQVDLDEGQKLSAAGLSTGAVVVGHGAAPDDVGEPKAALQVGGAGKSSGDLHVDLDGGQKVFAAGRSTGAVVVGHGAAPDDDGEPKAALQVGGTGKSSGDLDVREPVASSVAVLDRTDADVDVEVEDAGFLALASGGVALAEDDVDDSIALEDRSGAELTESEVIFEQFRSEDEAAGDRSNTWRHRGTRPIDRFNAEAPVRLAPVLPIVARVSADARYLRAMIGARSLVLPVASVLFALAGLADVDARPLPPAFALMAVMIVIGILDASAGLLGIAVFFAGVGLAGTVSDADDVRTLLGLGVIWFAVPLAAGAARNLRRTPPRNNAQRWDRAGDFVIASLIGAWVTAKMVTALGSLAGVELPIVESADELGLVALAAVVARLLLEETSVRLYPRRLSQLEPAEIPEPPVAQQLVSIAARCAVFVFVCEAFMGTCWQLWAGTVMFAIPHLVQIRASAIPNSPALFRLAPTRVVAIVGMLALGALCAVVAGDLFDEPADLVRNSFVLLSIPGFVLGILEDIGREGQPRVRTWPLRIAGSFVVVAGVYLATAY